MNNKIISLIGRSNTGKSSIFNLLLTKIYSVVTPKTNTTIRCIEGYLDLKENIKIIDTPGPIISEKKNRYNINKLIHSTVKSSDILLITIDELNLKSEDFFILEMVKNCTAHKILIINKIDKIKNKEHILHFVEKIKEKMYFINIIPVSQLKKINIDNLRRCLLDLYLCKDKNVIISLNETNHDIIKDLIRKVLLDMFYKEIPYTTSINIKSKDLKQTIMFLNIEFLVRKITQKKIIIGKNGNKVRKLKKNIKSIMKKNKFSCIKNIKIDVNKS